MEDRLSIFDDNTFKIDRELSIIINISQSLIGTLDYHEVLQIVSDGTSDLLEIDSAAIYCLKTDDEIYLEATTPPIDKHMPDSLRKAFLSEHPHIQKALSTRKSIILTDTNTADLTESERQVVELRGLRSILYLPLISGEDVLGVLILGTCDKAKQFSAHQIELCQSIANQLSVAIQNTQLHADLASYNVNLEKLVAERTNELLEANDKLHIKNRTISQKKVELEEVLKELKNTQSRLLQNEKMASLGTMIAGISHEINNPLNYLMGAYVGLNNYFNEHGSIEKEKTDMLLNSINSGIERISGILQGLHQFSRNNANMDEDCNIHSIINNCFAILQNESKHKIETKTEYLKEQILIKGNVGKLQLVFLNVLTNSIQAIDEKGIIVVKTRIEDNKAIIEIIDNGIGIDEKNLKMITDPFFTTKPPGKGAGLGLAIAYSIVKEHDGEINIESIQKKETKAIISLPLKQE